ncbi:28047_t:CDS:2, partial [Gigaspora margarita]
RFRHTSLAMVDHYTGSFELRVFKNQYAIEFLLPTGERYRECEQFARRILIGMSPNEATKLEQVYSKPSIKYNRPIGVDELRLSKDPIWSPSMHKIWRIVVGKNPPMLVLYYLD